MADQYPFFAYLSRMRYINRWGLMRNTVQENIQEHSHMVAVLAHALAVIRRDVFGGDADPGLAAAAALFFRALGAVGAMYFLALNTPVTDLTMCLGRLHVPRLLVELMELIYRFIFVLSETAGSIRTAQASRLGYQGLRRSLSSLGTMASLVFLRAWRRADRIYAALESRGYTGSLTTLPGDYAPGRGLYPLALAVAAGQLAVLFAERGVLG